MATALIAKMNGVDKASHINDKIVEMIHLNETIYSCGIACSATGEQTAAGNFQVNMLLANVCKLNVTRFLYELAQAGNRYRRRFAGHHAIGSGSRRSPGWQIYPQIPGANPEYETVDRMKVLRLIENLVAGAGAVGYLIDSMHGAGPPTAQRIMIRRQAAIDDKIDRVKVFLGIK